MTRYEVETRLLDLGKQAAELVREYDTEISSIHISAFQGTVVAYTCDHEWALDAAIYNDGTTHIGGEWTLPEEDV